MLIFVWILREREKKRECTEQTLNPILLSRHIDTFGSNFFFSCSSEFKRDAFAIW
jgi:hypothetical protein